MKEFIAEIENSKKVIALDFDGVIHNDNMGYYDGTIYGVPVDGVEAALKHLSKSYKLIIYSCKSNPNRPFINNKNGTQLIWDWLGDWNLKEYISDIQWGKPNAFIYIDDKGYKFENWKNTMNYLDGLL